jgi:hypothetical protein
MATRESLTIRFPPDLLASARQIKSDSESLNDLVISAVDREVRRRSALSAHERIMDIHRQAALRTGPQPHTAGLVRQLREGKGRLD